MRKLTAFLTGFAVVAIAGAAVAMGGSILPTGEPAPALVAPEQPAEKSPVATKPASGSDQEKLDATKEPKKRVSEPKSQEKVEKVGKEDTGSEAKVEEKADTEPPVIEIHHPVDGQRLDTKLVTFQGITEPGARVFAGPYEADVDTEGNWSIVLVLSPGQNLATLTAKDGAWNKAAASVTVIYDAPEEETTKKTNSDESETKEKDTSVKADFTANQKWGVSSEDPPYDVLYGQGRAGAWVKVYSDFGTGKTTIDEKGNWKLKVFFPDAPADKSFTVKVMHEDGEKAYFEFLFTP